MHFVVERQYQGNLHGVFIVQESLAKEISNPAKHERPFISFLWPSSASPVGGGHVPYFPIFLFLRYVEDERRRKEAGKERTLLQLRKVWLGNTYCICMVVSPIAWTWSGILSLQRLQNDVLPLPLFPVSQISPPPPIPPCHRARPRFPASAHKSRPPCWAQ